jgi:transposase
LAIALHTLDLFPQLRIVDHIDHGFRRITLRTRQITASASCPDCRITSGRVHGHYWRSLGDLPSFGRPVVLLVHVRRFRCINKRCPRRTFSEGLSGIARPRARHTERLRSLHQDLGLALGGNRGARIAAQIAAPVSGATLLHRIRQAAHAPPSPPRVLGVDDWAWRKGSAYGTILCDLERRCAIDLLPDRTAETLAAWLERHPSVEIVVRDRAGAYAEGARRGAPKARQIADRWHLLCNGSSALRALLDHHHRDLREAAEKAASELSAEDTPAPPAAKPEAPALTAAQRRSEESRRRREARFDQAARWHREGMSLRAIAQALGVERKTVRRWLRAGQAPAWRHADRGRGILDPFRSYLEARWTEGCRNATALWRDLREQGFAGQVRVVRQWATQQRRADPAAEVRGASKPAPPQSVPPPTSRKAARLLMAETDKLAADERRFVTALLALSPPIAHATGLIRRYAEMVKNGLAERLKAWINEAGGSDFKGFAASLRQDYDAVHAALSEPWSTGLVEGHINRLKLIKRDMYGRAGFDLLRSRVLAAA